ncbi:MAG: NADH-quinone oxidoreductase subunit C [Flavobacteriales bacterium]|nr:NADH-quinone oxidoreductase subunit C [Flavobacteriales bacterium]
MHHEIHPNASAAATELHDAVKEALTKAIGEGLVRSQIDYDMPVFILDKNKVHDGLSFLKNDPSMKFGFLTTMCGIHFPDNKGEEFALMYQLHSLEKNHRIRIKTFMSEKDLVMPTITDIWLAADWMERETFDFYGFKFAGHPDLRRILNMDEMNYHPLRKEYALEDASRDDKQDKYFGR